MITRHGSVSAIGFSARQNIWMACESKTFKDEVAGMENPSLQSATRWEELLKLEEF